MATDEALSDREAILARRALFISSALAALSCGPGPRATTPPTTNKPQAETETPQAEHTSDDGSPATPPSDDPVGGRSAISVLTPWATLAAEIPPLDVPAGLPEDEAKPLVQQATRLREGYNRLQRLWTSVPAICELSNDRCHASWIAFAREFQELRQLGRGLIPRCGFGHRASTTVVQRANAHQHFFGLVLDQIQLAVLHDHGIRGTDTVVSYQTIEQEVAVPVPCLMCFTPEGFRVVGVTVLFPESSADLSKVSHTNLNSVARQMFIEPDIHLEIRGHGDPGEGAAVDAIARARAEEVLQFMLHEGIAADRLQVQDFGARLLVDSPQTEAGRRKNRRVDFVVTSDE